MLPLLLVLLSSSVNVSAGPDPLYARVDGLLQRLYLKPDEIVVADALEMAAEAAEDAIPWLMVERQEGRLRLSHGESGEFAVMELGDRALVPGLETLEALIRSAPGELPEEIELPVELLRGVTRALDPHTTLLYKGRLQSFDERVQGTFAGIGARIGREDEVLTVRQVFPDSPAAKGGLRDGDRVLEVDGFSTAGLTVDQSVRRIRGPEGSEVVLGVERTGPDGEAQSVVVRITRGVIRIPNVTWRRLDSGVLVVEIENFSKQTVAFLHDALADIEGVKGVVIDLRGNSGGSLIQACGVVDTFVAGGSIVSVVGQDGEPVKGIIEGCEAKPEVQAAELPLIVLVDGSSASASEIVAGALQGAGRAVMMGQRTYGKGTVQKAYPVRGGSPEDRVELKLTEAEYLVNGQRRIAYQEGLEPDVSVERVVFTSSGAWLPEASEVDFVLVDERPGWRDRGADAPRADPTLALAERALLAAKGPSQEGVLAGISEIRAALLQEEDARLVATFGEGGLDWSAASEAGPAPQVEVNWTSAGPYHAGEEATLRVSVRNRGATPLRRAYVRLDADARGTAWGGRSVSIGEVPPGETREGEIKVRISPSSPPRLDRLTPTLYTDERPPLVLADLPVEIIPMAPAPFAVSAAIRPSGEAYALELDLQNLGEAPLGELRAWVAMSEQAAAELLAREASVPGVVAGGSARAAVPLRLPEGLTVVEGLELRVEAEGHGELLRAPLSLSPGASPQHLEAPRVNIQLPLEAEAGALSAQVTASDDGQVVEVTAWWDGGQVAWRSGGASTLSFELPLVVEPGAHMLWVQVVDDQGVKVFRGHSVQGPREP